MNIVNVEPRGKVWKVPSFSRENVIYYVWRCDGKWFCTCPATVERPFGKFCRHVKWIATKQLKRMLREYEKLMDAEVEGIDVEV